MNGAEGVPELDQVSLFPEVSRLSFLSIIRIVASKSVIAITAVVVAIDPVGEITGRLSGAALAPVVNPSSLRRKARLVTMPFFEIVNGPFIQNDVPASDASACFVIVGNEFCVHLFGVVAKIFQVLPPFLGERPIIGDRPRCCSSRHRTGWSHFAQGSFESCGGASSSGLKTFPVGAPPAGGSSPWVLSVGSLRGLLCRP